MRWSILAPRGMAEGTTNIGKDTRPVRKILTVREKNIIYEPLVEGEKIIFPPLDIKLGPELIMEQLSKLSVWRVI